MSILVTICARGGSKGVPRKNLRELAGHSLLEIAISKSLALGEDVDVVVSTDDEQIAEAARAAGAKVPFLRPAALATDTAPKFPVLKHALEESERAFNKKYDLIVDVDVSVPFPSPEDMQNAIQVMKGNPDVDTLAAAYESDHSPYFNMMEENEEGYISVCKKPKVELRRRQDAPIVYQLTAGILATRRKVLLERDTVYTDRAKPYVMSPEKSVMIDSELDFKLAEFLIKENVVEIGWVEK
jgi:N-acylneuraminate cytidylyltransferase/CMP-N,N'-diacetyllegionaminic acid synthase